MTRPFIFWYRDGESQDFTIVFAKNHERAMKRFNHVIGKEVIESQEVMPGVDILDYTGAVVEIPVIYDWKR